MSNIESMQANSEIIEETREPRTPRRGNMVENYRSLESKYRAALYRLVNGKWVLTDEDRAEVTTLTANLIAKRYHTTPERVLAIVNAA